MTAGACVHDGAGERAHGSEAGRGDSDDDGNRGSADDLAGDAEGFVGVEFGSFAHNAEDGETGDAAGLVEVGAAVDGGVVDCAAGRNGVTAMAKTPLAVCRAFMADFLRLRIRRHGTLP